MDPEIRHGYFVLQTRAQSTGTELSLTGVVENLTTGDKWRFATAEELTHLLQRWGTNPGSKTTNQEFGGPK